MCRCESVCCCHRWRPRRLLWRLHVCRCRLVCGRVRRDDSRRSGGSVLRYRVALRRLGGGRAAARRLLVLAGGFWKLLSGFVVFAGVAGLIRALAAAVVRGRGLVPAGVRVQDQTIGIVASHRPYTLKSAPLLLVSKYISIVSVYSLLQIQPQGN